MRSIKSKVRQEKIAMYWNSIKPSISETVILLAIGTSLAVIIILGI